MTNHQMEIKTHNSTANKFTLKCMYFTVLAFAFVWFLNMIDVFIVDRNLMTATFVISSAIFLLPAPVCHFIGSDKTWIKYFILFCCALATTIIGCALSFHSVLLFALPLIYAAQYSRRRVIYYAYILSATGVFVSVMCSYFFGICDANMLLLTNNTTSFYTDPQTGALINAQINADPWGTLPKYFVLPRCLILLVFVPVIRNISKNIANTAVRTANLVEATERDRMTRFYNKGKYEQMITGYYTALDTVAVVFWDVDHLKYTNDTFGHDKGDFLIMSIADVIREHTDETHKAYRIGGDEFIMVVENPKPDEARLIAERCEKQIAAINESSYLSVSASVGCAVGAAKDIKLLIQKADALMYKAKKESNAERV